MRAWIWIGLLAGCGGDPVDTDPGPDGAGRYSASLGEGPDFTRPHGLVHVHAWEVPGDMSLDGVFADGPPLELRTESRRDGQCRLMTYTPSHCSPACADDELCVDGTCEAWPERADLGPLQWTFPGGDQTVEADALLNYRASGRLSGHGQVALEGDFLDLAVPTLERPVPVGDWYEAIHGRDGGDAVLSWSNSHPDARVRLAMTDCTGSHGGIGAAEIECEGPDTGELRLPAAFLDAFDAGDWSHGECGSHRLVRYHADAEPDATEVRLESRAWADFWYRPDL